MITNRTQTLSNDLLFDRAVAALVSGAYASAYAAVDKLCCPERARECVDLLPLPRKCPALAGYSAAQLQPLTDRIEQFNSYVLSR